GIGAARRRDVAPVDGEPELGGPPRARPPAEVRRHLEERRRARGVEHLLGVGRVGEGEVGRRREVAEEAARRRRRVAIADADRDLGDDGREERPDEHEDDERVDELEEEELGIAEEDERLLPGHREERAHHRAPSGSAAAWTKTSSIVAGRWATALASSPGTA